MPNDESETPGKQLVLLNGGKMLAQGAGDHSGDNGAGECQADGDQKHRPVITELRAKECHSWHTDEPIGSASPSRRLEQDQLGNLGEDKGDEYEIDARQTENQGAKRQRE
ncbi:hypothetical protein GALL_524560 [mine drainage metagenome]|uniref:Uncharacterized protein n=1 Tax=mine drainage metagenome TaxID=410659 RepID=A0A1J5P481_9ZZZZ